MRSLRFAIMLGLASAVAAPAAGQTGRVVMHTVLEKTLLSVDVLSLDVCVDSAASARIRELLAMADGDGVEDSIAAMAVAANDVIGRIEFLRNVSFEQFIDGIVEEQRKAVSAGWLDDSTHTAVRASLPQWFGFLEERNVKDGDVIVYHITGDTIHTTFTAVDGTVMLDRFDAGPSRRRSIVVTWFAPGSGFRKGLLRSLRRPAAGAGDVCAAPPSGLQ